MSLHSHLFFFLVTFKCLFKCSEVSFLVTGDQNLYIGLLLMMKGGRLKGNLTRSLLLSHPTFVGFRTLLPTPVREKNTISIDKSNIYPFLKELLIPDKLDQISSLLHHLPIANFPKSKTIPEEYLK